MWLHACPGRRACAQQVRAAAAVALAVHLQIPVHDVDLQAWQVSGWSTWQGTSRTSIPCALRVQLRSRLRVGACKPTGASAAVLCGPAGAGTS